MTSYRLLMLDHRMMTFGSRDVACEADDVAEAEAADLARSCRAVEVWCGARLVARVQYQSLPSWRSGLDDLPRHDLVGAAATRVI